MAETVEDTELNDDTARFELRQLQHFLVVFRCGSYSEAGYKLGLTQQAVSASIKKLESNLGVTLFLRGRLGATPTQEGEELLHHAQLILEDAKAAYEKVSSLGTGQAGSIRIGIADDPFGAFAAEAIVKMQMERPRVVPHIVQDLSYRLREQMEEGVLDIICASPPKAWRSDRYMNVERIGESRLAILCGNAHPLAARESVSMADLAEFPWIYPSARVQAVIEDQFWKAGIRPPQSFTMVDGPSTISMTLMAMGEHLMPGNSKITDGVIGKSFCKALPIDFENQKRFGCMAYRRAGIDTEVRTYLMNLIRETAAGSNTINQE